MSRLVSIEAHTLLLISTVRCSVSVNVAPVAFASADKQVNWLICKLCQLIECKMFLISRLSIRALFPQSQFSGRTYFSTARDDEMMTQAFLPPRVRNMTRKFVFFYRKRSTVLKLSQFQHDDMTIVKIYSRTVYVLTFFDNSQNLYIDPEYGSGLGCNVSTPELLQWLDVLFTISAITPKRLQWRDVLFTIDIITPCIDLWCVVIRTVCGAVPLPLCGGRGRTWSSIAWSPRSLARLSS